MTVAVVISLASFGITIQKEIKYNRINVASNKSSLLLKIILQKTQTFQLFKINIKLNFFTKVIKCQTSGLKAVNISGEGKNRIDSWFN